MRTLDEIRTEMADAASYYEYAKQAGLEIPMARHEAVYGALAWVLEEPWKNEGEFDTKNGKPEEKATPAKTVKTVFLSLNYHKNAEIETTIWSDDTVTYKHRVRTNENTTDWSDWKDGEHWYI